MAFLALLVGCSQFLECAKFGPVKVWTCIFFKSIFKGVRGLPAPSNPGKNVGPGPFFLLPGSDTLNYYSNTLKNLIRKNTAPKFSNSKFSNLQKVEVAISLVFYHI